MAVRRKGCIQMKLHTGQVANGHGLSTSTSANQRSAVNPWPAHRREVEIRSIQTARALSLAPASAQRAQPCCLTSLRRDAVASRGTTNRVRVAVRATTLGTDTREPCANLISWHLQSCGTFTMAATDWVSNLREPDHTPEVCSGFPVARAVPPHKSLL